MPGCQTREENAADMARDEARDEMTRDEVLEVLKTALALLLNDVEGSVDYGMPFENPEHGFHESVMAARRALESS